ncbi:MAG: T9SS type A sorting domain-containing protein, partial [Endomicrobia bacterium]|nr:T9SS type A sorting domain-containing protein [Endomicrobiia bacterium]
KGLPSPRGLLIWHIDESMPNNDNSSRPMVSVEAANGKGPGGSSSAHYFRAGHNTSFTDTTTPNSKSYDGLNAGKPITAISAPGAVMTFRVGGGGTFIYATIDTITPTEGRRNTTVSVQINGTNLLSGSTARLVNGANTINATAVTYNSSNRLTASFTIPDTATIGKWNLVVSSSAYIEDITKTGIFMVLGNTMAITNVTPDIGIRGTTLRLNVTGTDYQSGVAIKLVSGATTINGTSITRTGTTGITASFVIPPTVAHGTKFDLTITNTSGDYVTRTQAVTINSDPTIDDTFPMVFKYYPNPVRNGSITLANDSIKPATVTICTYLGGKIKTIRLPAGGSRQWDTKNENGDKVASGVYLCRIEYDGGKSKTVKIVVHQR